MQRVAVGALLILTAFGGLALAARYAAGAAPPRSDVIDEAARFCQARVREKLPSPESALFASPADERVWDIPAEHALVVSSTVDAPVIGDRGHLSYQCRVNVDTSGGVRRMTLASLLLLPRT